MSLYDTFRREKIFSNDKSWKKFFQSSCGAFIWIFLYMHVRNHVLKIKIKSESKNHANEQKSNYHAVVSLSP